MRDYIPINKELVPYSFNILLADEWFELLVDYNGTADMFTVSVYKEGNLVCAEPLILGVPLFKDTYRPGFPAVTLVPQDPSGTEKRVSYENLGKSVFLTIDDEPDEGVEVSESI